MERRAYPRYALQLDAKFSLSTLPPQPCTIRNFCVGGLFVAFDATVRELVARYRGTVASDESVAIEFGIRNEQGQSQHFQIGCKVARVTATGVGVSFSQPDPLAIAALHRLAMRYPGGLQGSEAASRGAPAVLNTSSGRSIMQACTKVVEDLLSGKFKTLFTQTGTRLVTAASESKSDVEQSTYFDAITELNARQAAIGDELLVTLLRGLEQLGTFRVQRKEQHSTQELTGLSLVDKDAFEDFLAISEMVSRAEERLHDRLTEFEDRLTGFVEQRIDASSNPLGPAAICHAFGDVLEGLNVAAGPMKQVYACFEDEIVRPLDKLYDALNRILEDAGIAPAERQSPPLHRARPSAGPPRPPATPGAADYGQGNSPDPMMPEAVYPAQPFPGPIPGGMPVGHGVSPSGGSMAAAGVGRAQAAAVASPVPAAPVPGRDGSPGFSPIAAGSAAPGGVPTSAPVSTPGGYGGVSAVPRPSVGLVADHGHEIMQAAYLAAQTILGLQRQVGAAGTGIPIVGGAAAAMEPAAQQALPVYQTGQIIDTLSALQRQEQSQPPVELLSLDRGAQLQSALSQRHGGAGPMRIGEREADVLGVIAQMFDAIGQDELLPERVKERMIRLHTPLQKVALLDDAFFLEDSHPARKVLNQMARLETGFDDEATWAVVDPAIQRLVKEFDQDVGMFKQVVDELDELLHQQSEVYEENLTAVVAACEDQQAFIKSREKAEASRRKAEDRGVPEEWREWLNRARRLKPGAAVAMTAGSGQPRRLTLAWVGEDYSSFVFVDAKGKKVATLTLQELGMHLRRGSIIVLPESELSVVDRALYSMLHDMHGQLEQQATHDQLTGLVNRREFEARVGAALKKAVQEHEKHVVARVEIDRFADIEGGRGQKARDNALKEVARVMRESLGERVVLARLGGHEFGVLVENCSPEEGYRLLESLRRAVQEITLGWKDEFFSVTASAGLVPVTNRAESVGALLKACDAACRAAQEEGGNRVKAYQASEGQVAERKGVMEWVSQINKTLGDDRVQLRCQRVEPLQERDVGKVRYEIFLGLRDDDGAPVPTAEFLEAAEYYHQMPTLDRWLIKSVFHWMSENAERMKDISGCVINLADPTLSDGQLLDYVMEQLSESRVPPGKICFEVTETAALSTLSEAEQFIRTMTEFGCRFSLDDFGGGDKTYSYLKTLPVDFVKINGSYVKNIATSAEDYAVVKSANEIAHFMGKRTIAGFVENEDAAKKLVEIGVDYVQGYWIEEPVYLEDMDVNAGAPRLRTLLESGIQEPPLVDMPGQAAPAVGTAGSVRQDDQEGTIRLD